MPAITLELTDAEYQLYLDGLATVRETAEYYSRSKILITFNTPPGVKTPMIRAAVPDDNLVDFEQIAGDAWAEWSEDCIE